MQVSFDFGRRLWLGVGYAPRRTPTGETEISPAAFDFGVTYDKLSGDGRTRERYTVLDGQVRLHSFGLDVTGFRYDLSHRYQRPLLRITTFVREPARHDLYLNIGLYAETLHFEVAPRGIEGEQSLTLATAQGTLDLWQSEDLRSYVRLRVGPGIEMRFGPWGDETRYVGILPAGDAGGERHPRPARDAAAQLPAARRSAALRDLAGGAAARRLDGDRRRRVRGDPAGDQRSAGVAAPRRQRVPARRRAADRGGDPDVARVGMDGNRRHPDGVLLPTRSSPSGGSLRW